MHTMVGKPFLLDFNVFSKFVTGQCQQSDRHLQNWVKYANLSKNDL